MKKILEKLFEHQRLAREEAKEVLLQIAAGQYNDIQVAAFTTVFQMRPICVAELQGFRDALLELCVPFQLDDTESIDIVGTGGDGKNTFNISTTSAFVVAGAGFKVTKHGSYGVSSAVGSSNVLLELGYSFTNDTDELKQQLERSNICFLHAPLFHPALKQVVPVRKQLGMKTFFNMLGPLVNPIQPQAQLFGTYSLELARLYQYIMQESGRKFTIVYALDGYDEVSLTGAVSIKTNDWDELMAPEDFGKTTLQQSDLYGGETEAEAAAILLQVLKNQSTAAQKDVVVVNAALAIHTLCPEKSLGDCIGMATESLESGRALQVLKRLIG
ncbi:MAG TPA: anthranilate phosphoribosyltransferase [Saprospiraceae bacterium]|nr:anthranilate phosphoribosyltransferase [Saprospiraceae bacterium]HMQ85824.1 anthranilate phosphoribosyltransferase [Saprospiraceae bacterium]